MTREEIIKWLESLKAEIGKAEHRTLWHYAEAIDMYEKVVGNMAHEINMLKEQLESAEAEWIPCSERLPERSGAYLVWMQWPCDEEPTASIINYDADCEMFGEWHELYHPRTLGYLDSDFDEIKGVIAWMPLPEPYKGGDEE